MKGFLLLLAIAALQDSCLGLQPTLHYKYKYYGSVFTGIPELKDQGAGWAMKADVHVYAPSNDGVVIFQLQEVLMAEYNINLGCDSHGAPPDNLFHRPEGEDLAHAIESPFTANLFADQDFAISFEDHKYLWLTNMRKGIAAVLKNEILDGNADLPSPGSIAEALHNGHIRNIFSVKEETMFGKCNVDYTIYPLPEDLAGPRNRAMEAAMEGDVQRPDQSGTSSGYTKKPHKGPSKTSKKSPGRKSSKKLSKTAQKYRKKAPKIEDGLWHVTRSVDLDDCDDRVDFQVTPLGVFRDTGGSQYEWSRSRSSVSEYIFRGAAGHMRMEGAVVEGASTVNPMGFKTQSLQARTNQTYQLVSVSVEKHPTLNCKESTKTWMYEVISHATVPTESKRYPWVVYTGKGSEIHFPQYFGIDAFTPKDISKIKDTIKEYVNHAALTVSDTDQESAQEGPGVTAKDVHQASILFKQINDDDICEIFEHYFGKDLHHHDVVGKKLIVDAAAASGTYFAHKAILKYIKSGQIPPLQIMTIFMTLSNNAQCPLNIPELMEYVMSVDMKTHPFLASTVLINFAELVRHMCIMPNSREVRYAGPLYGDAGCPMDKLKGVFLPFLRDLIHEDNPDWEKIVAIQALHNLGTPFSFPILAPVIEGSLGCADDVRRHAMQAFESFVYVGHEDSTRTQMVDLMTDVYSDVGENPEVRSVALSIVMSWRPGNSFWHRLARTTWREPSKIFASYTTALIESYANFQDPFFLKQSQAAQHALKYVKPSTFRKAYVTMHHAEIVESHIRKLSMMAQWSTFDSESFYYFLMTEMGGFNLIQLELNIGVHEFFKQIKKSLDKTIESDGVEGIAARIAQDFYDRIQDTIKSETVKHGNVFYSEIFVRLFDHMKLYLPISKETIGSLPFTDPTKLGELAVALSLGHDLVLSKFFTPIDLTTFHPTELGVPVFGKVSTPILLSSISYTKISLGGRSYTQSGPIDALKKLQVTSETLIRISSEATSAMHVLLPWRGYLVTTGVRATRDIVLPLDIEVRRDEKEDEGQYHIVRVTLQSHFKKKFSLLRATNTPFTAATPILPIDDHNPPVFKCITNEPKTVKITTPGKYTGLALDVTWESEMAFPLYNWNLREMLTESSNLEGSPWFFYAWTSPTAKFWSIDVEIDPALSQTKNITFEYMAGVFGKSGDDLTQKTGQEDFSQYGQEGDYGDYDQEPYDVDSGFQVSQGFQEIGKEVETTNQVNYGDSLKQRSEKLQGHFGGSAHTNSLKIDFNGAEHRSYEVVYSYTRSRASDTRKIKKSQISLLRSAIPNGDDKPASMCLDVQASSPAFSKLDTVESLLASDLDKEFKAELTLDCTGKSVLTVKGKKHISDEWKEKIIHDVDEACDHDPFDSLYNFHSHAVYDDITVDAEWEKVCDLERFPLTTKLFNLAEKALDFHLIDFQNCDHRDVPHKVHLDAHRSPRSGDWAMNARRGQGARHLENIPHNELFSDLFAVGRSSYVEHPEHYSVSDIESHKCILGVDSVRTFDGFSYDFEPSECWKVAAKECHVKNGWMLLVRSSKGESSVPDAKFINVKKGLVIEYENHAVKVNGKIVDPIGEQEAVKNDEGETLVIVHKKNDFHMVQFSNDFYITAKDKIQIHVSEDMCSQTCGLCGNSDDEPESELIGPHRCFYSDPNLFAASWTAGSDTCDLYTLAELREKAENFQKNCTTIETIHDTCPHFNPRRYHYGWMVRKEGTDKSCMSNSPLPHCEEKWHSHGPGKLITFNCWPNDEAPSAIKDALERGDTYMVEPVATEPHSHAYHYLYLPTTCITVPSNLR